MYVFHIKTQSTFSLFDYLDRNRILECAFYFEQKSVPINPFLQIFQLTRYFLVNFHTIFNVKMNKIFTFERDLISANVISGFPFTWNLTRV